MATKSSLDSVYIPLCRREICLQWLQRIVEGLKENHVKCQAVHPINGKFTYWFTQFFEECDFTIIHYCPCLWKRIYSLFDYFQSQDEKLILIKFFPNESDMALDLSETSCKTKSLETFFDEMDSEQRIVNDTDLKDFIGNIIHSTSLRLKQGSVESLEDTETESIGLTSSSCNNTHSPVVHHHGIKKQHDFYAPENQMEVSNNFKKYYDLFGSMEDMSVFIRSCDAEWISPSGWQDGSRDKVHQINEFSVDDMQSICFILHRASIDTELSVVMQSLNEETLSDQKSSELKEHLAQVSLMLLSNIILLSESSQNAASSAEQHFTAKEKEFSSSIGTSDDPLKDFIADGVRCSQVYEVVNKFLQMESQTEYNAKNLQKESFCVQFVVLYELLRKVFCLRKEPLQFLEEYLKPTRTKFAWKKKSFPHRACFTMLLRGMTLFLSHSVRKKGHMDTKEICTQSLNILAAIAVEDNSKLEVEKLLLPLIFDSRDSVRQEVKDILKKTKKDGKESLLNFGVQTVEQLLFPYVKDVPNISVRMKNEGEIKGKTSSHSLLWNEFKIKYFHLPARLFIHSVITEDHDKLNKTLLKEHKDLCYTEILNLVKLKHENVITMFAFQVVKMPQFYILQDGQILQIALKNARDNQKFLEHKVLCKFLVDALKGLRYCHDQGYIHRNLTAHSLCAFNMHSVKLCDFGLCMKQPSFEVAIDKNSQTIPLRWSAPESIFDGEFSKISDIWMVGHLIYEVLTHGLLPYSPSGLSDEDFVEAMLKSNISLQREQCLNDRVFNLITKCTDYNSQIRPSVEEVLTMFEDIHMSSTELPKSEMVYPSIDGVKGIYSIHFSRGIPDKHCLKNIYRSGSHTAGYQIIHLSDSMDQISVDGHIVIKEKLVHPLSMEATACIHSKEFQDILPPLKLHKNSIEAEQIVIEISSSSRHIYQVFQQRRFGDGVSVYMMLLYEVAKTLSELHARSWIIGDLSPSFVYVDKKTLKPCIVSLALLQHIGQKDATNPEIVCEADKIRPNRQSSAAPEVLSSGLFSFASDVFCFGNFIWVLLTAFDKSEELINKLNDEEIRPFADFPQKKQFQQALMTGKWKDFNQQPQCCPEELYRLILQCVSINEKDRPSMQQMCEHLKGLFKKEEIEYAISDDKTENKNDELLLEANPSVSSFSSHSSNHGKESKKWEKNKRSFKLFKKEEIEYAMSDGNTENKNDEQLLEANPSVSSFSSSHGKELKKREKKKRSFKFFKKEDSEFTSSSDNREKKNDTQLLEANPSENSYSSRSSDHGKELKKSEKKKKPSNLFSLREKFFLEESSPSEKSVDI